MAAKKSGVRIGLALGAGGARGWAHIGAIRALEEAGLRPEVVTGTSMGAAVGAVYAAGMLDEFEAWARGLDRSTLLSLFDLSLRGGLIQAHRVFDHLEEILPNVDIEELDMPFAAVATDLDLGTEVRIRTGNLRHAVRASIAIPGLISPGQLGGRWMVDGGLLNPVPVTLARELGADAVIAVELSATKALSPAIAALTDSVALPAQEEIAASNQEAGPKAQASSDFFEALSEASESFWAQVSSEEPDRRATPSVYEVIGQSLQIMQTRITRGLMAGDPPELHIIPRLQNVGLMDFDRAEAAIVEGRRAVRVALNAQADFRMPETSTLV